MMRGSDKSGQVRWWVHSNLPAVPLVGISTGPGRPRTDGTVPEYGVKHSGAYIQSSLLEAEARSNHGKVQTASRCAQ